jgi:hypothetical protein
MTGTVTASFEFLQWQDAYSKQKPYEIFLPLDSLGDKKTKIPRSNLVFEPRTILAEDAAGREDEFALDRHGFQFAKHFTKITDLKDRRAVTDLYVPEMEEFLRGLLQVEDTEDIRTFCFDLRVSS